MKKLILSTFMITILLADTAHAATQTVFVDVNGLVCDFCARALEKVFSKQDAVQDIDVNLDTKVVTINFKDGQTLEDDQIKKLITDSGYNVENIRHESSEIPEAADE